MIDHIKMTIMKGLIIIFLGIPVSFLHSKTINVPRDYVTIKMAVAASHDGDAVVVDDGIYYEKNVIVDKDIQLVSKNLYGAIVYGSIINRDSIFIVRARAEIAGFVLLNSYRGIVQRNSPDVEWRARDLIIVSMVGAGIEINDEWGKIGSAYIENIVFDSCPAGIVTNDARKVRATGCILIGCSWGFQGESHLSFVVDKSILINCRQDFADDADPISRDAPRKIIRGREVYSTKSNANSITEIGFRKLLSQLWRVDFGRYVDRGMTEKRRAFMINKISGDWSFSQNDHAQAIEDWSMALEIGHAVGLTALSWRIAGDLSQAFDGQGNERKSLEYLRRAADEIISLSAALPLGYFQESFIEDKVLIFENLIDRLSEGDHGESGQDSALEAFLYSEKFKLLGAPGLPLQPRRMFVDEERVPSPGGRGKDALNEISRLQRLLNDVKMSVEERRIVLEKLEDSEDEYKAYLLYRPLCAADVFPAVDLTELRSEETWKRTLGRNSAIIEFFSGLNNIFVFLLTRDDIQIAKIPGTDRFDSLVSNYLEYLKNDSRGEFAGRTGGRILYEALLGRLEMPAMTNVTKLTIIPDGVLNYLPFEALVMSAFSDQTASPSGIRKKRTRDPFMIERYEISYASSLTQLIFLANSPRKKEYKVDLLAVVNSRPKQPLLGFGSLPVLRYAAEEVDRIARRFGPTRAEVVRGESASEAFLKNRDLSEFKIIHIAAHGILDLFCWWRSALLLDRGEGSNEDGLLQPLDIMGLDFEAELIVLSSCKSGNVPPSRGRVAVGLHELFFQAGAKAALCSLWEINDRSTVRLMNAFYSELLKGNTASAALRSAKLDLLRSRDSQPRLWAAFVITGACSFPIYPASEIDDFGLVDDESPSRLSEKFTKVAPCSNRPKIDRPLFDLVNIILSEVDLGKRSVRFEDRLELRIN